MPATSVFQLNKCLNNKYFGGLASGDVPSVLRRDPKITANELDSIHNDFFPTVPFTWDWESTKLAPVWKAAEVKGNPTSYNDYPCLDLTIPAFSERAVAVLADLLEPNGELLPVTFMGRNYFVYNCQKVVQIINHLESIGAFHDPYSAKKAILNIASSIAYMSVYPERLDGLTIFKMRELPGQTFATDEFVKRVRQYGLNGFEFIKTWPLPPGTNYFKEHLKRSKNESERKYTTEPINTDGELQSIVIELSSKGRKVSSREKKWFAKLQEELCVQLCVTDNSGDNFGHIEQAHCDSAECRFVISCKNSKLLHHKLKQWLQHLDWSGKIKVFVRPHDFAGPSDNEQVVVY